MLGIPARQSLAAALLGCCFSAQAASIVFFDQGLTPAQEAATTTAGRSGSLKNFTYADRFTASDGTSLTDIHFWTLEAAAATAPSVIQYYVWDSLTVGADADGGLLASGAVSSYARSLEQSGVTAPGNASNRWYYEFDLPAAYTFDADGTYYLGLHFGAANNGGGAEQGWEFLSGAAGATGNYRVLCSVYTSDVCTDFAKWQAQGGNNKDVQLAFRLTTPLAADPADSNPPGGNPPDSNPPGTNPPGSNGIPEPGTLALLGLGLAGLAASRRRRQ